MKKAHRIKPVISIGKNGFSEKIIAAVSDSLDYHELIKVKFIDFKQEKKAIAEELAIKSNSILVKIIGNIAVLYKAKADINERKFHVPGIYSGENA